jgi:signal transduction histidine kinase
MPPVEVDADRVCVTDTGCGMSEEDLERAFQAFYRGSRTGDRGHGIGLAIVRRIADRYGWRVALESTLGKGTRATVHFPAAQPPDAALPAQAGVEAPRARRQAWRPYCWCTAEPG